MGIKGITLGLKIKRSERLHFAWFQDTMFLKFKTYISSFSKQNHGCQKVGMKGKGRQCEYKVVAQGVFLLVMEQFYISIVVVVVSQIYTADEISQTVNTLTQARMHIKSSEIWMDLVICYYTNVRFLDLKMDRGYVIYYNYSRLGEGNMGALLLFL